MKKLISVVAITLALTACAGPNSERVQNSTVSKTQYVSGTGLVYARQSPQVSAASVRQGEEYLAKIKQNDPIAEDQARVMEKQRELEKNYELQKVAGICRGLVDMHAALLQQSLYNNPTKENLRAFDNFQNGENYKAFERCVYKHYNEAK